MFFYSTYKIFNVKYIITFIGIETLNAIEICDMFRK